jgi:hypothetical protein
VVEVGAHWGGELHRFYQNSQEVEYIWIYSYHICIQQPGYEYDTIRIWYGAVMVNMIRNFRIYIIFWPALVIVSSGSNPDRFTTSHVLHVCFCVIRGASGD